VLVVIRQMGTPAGLDSPIRQPWFSALSNPQGGLQGQQLKDTTKEELAHAFLWAASSSGSPQGGLHTASSTVFALRRCHVVRGPQIISFPESGSIFLAARAVRDTSLQFFFEQLSPGSRPAESSKFYLHLREDEQERHAV